MCLCMYMLIWVGRWYSRGVEGMNVKYNEILIIEIEGKCKYCISSIFVYQVNVNGCYAKQTSNIEKYSIQVNENTGYRLSAN